MCQPVSFRHLPDQDPQDRPSISRRGSPTVITVIDYGRGNLFSLGQALRHVGAPYETASTPEAAASAAKIILPGVGAFGDAAAGLNERGLWQPLIASAARGVPILGICVGCQLLLDAGEEFGHHAGLALIPGRVRKLNDPCSGDARTIRLPNVGWRRLEMARPDPVISPEGKSEMMYFVHSFAPYVDVSSDAVAHLEVNGSKAPVAIRRRNVVGVQFHPEKSGPAGLAILARFTNWNGTEAEAK
ncbi:MAG: imidazole glycerol phosphate synthase subunit HisH [Hyphomicrobium sp.]